MKRVKIGLSLLAAVSALTLPLAPAASAAPAAPSAPSAAKIGLALVPASRPAPTPTASAGIGGPVTNADQDGACNSLANGDGDFCLWFSTNFVGSLSDHFTSKPNLATSTFLTPGLGLGSVVANNSESALNADTRLSVVVFTGTNSTGAGGLVTPRGFGNFNPTFVNNVESFRFQ